MSFINYSSREINCKVVYYGAGLSGKTSCMQYIYAKVNPDAKGKMISLATETERTLFCDFLPLSLGQIRGFQTRVHLYSVPGQDFYWASRLLVMKGVDGVIFVADSQQERVEANLGSMEELATTVRMNGRRLEELPLVIQYNKRDLPNALGAEELRRLINKMGVPDFETTATSGVGIFEALKCVMQLVLRELKKGSQSDGLGVAVQAGERLRLAGNCIPFQELEPVALTEALVSKLHGVAESPLETPFFRAWVGFPDTFPLGVDGCVFCIPPRELPGSVVIEQLNAERDLLHSLKIVFCPDVRQRDAVLNTEARNRRLLAAVDPWQLRDIVNADDSQEAFAGLVASQVTPVRIAPYRTTSGVRNGRVFFGRSDVISEILGRSRENFIVVGGRRLGKTALLQALQRESRRSARQYMYISLAGDDLRSRLADILQLPPGATFDEVVECLRRGLPRVLLIDEVDAFIAQEETTDFARLRALRSLSSSSPCSFVLAGHWTLFRACVLDHRSPLMNFGELIRLGPLKHDECTKLASQPMKTLGIDYDSAATLDHLVNTTGGRANLVSRICRELLDHIGDRGRISRTDLDAVLGVRQVLEDMEGWKYLSGRHEGSPAVARANTLDRVVVYSTIVSGRFTVETLHHRLDSLGALVSNDELEQSVMRLELDYMIRPDGEGFTYAVPLLRDRLMARSPSELLIRELRELGRTATTGGM